MSDVSIAEMINDQEITIVKAMEPRPGEPTDLATFAVLLRGLTAEIYRRAHAFAREQGLHPTDVQALTAILDAEHTDPGAPMTAGALRERLGLTSGAVTACLDRLERAGHIRRTRDGPDRRVVHLYYAAQARAVARDYFQPLAEGAERARRRFSEPELQVVVRFLAALNEELTRLRTEP